jgi:hypothetical protein
MADISTLSQMLWITSLGLRSALLVLLIGRKSYQQYSAFTFYIAATLTQGLLLVVVYRYWGFSSSFAIYAAWSMQAVLLCARALAIVELCHHLLGRFRGLWALAWRILLACGSLILLYSLVVSRHRWTLAVMNADRASELAIAGVIVALLFFTRYYDVELQPPNRLLAITFCVYSCFLVLNDTLFDQQPDRLLAWWNLLGIVAFLIPLFLWTWAFRKPLSGPLPAVPFLAEEVYRKISPEINLRLRLLNDQLSHFWDSEPPSS